MKKLVFLALLLLLGACSRENAPASTDVGTSTNENAPVSTDVGASSSQTAVSLPCENPLLNESGDIAKENARPLSSACVDGLFQRIEQACAAQDGERLLSQITLEDRQFILSRKPESVSVFDHASYLCRDMANIKAQMHASSANPSYGLFKRGASARLCFYEPGQRDCEGGLRVGFEDNEFKLNEH
ncbi:hypothetical protein AGMMS49545_21930 [Betaproteobacteria bacterium]|nr:hypothetical protein AGMMS49545_21930 [Betaproteobacteria bacterium]GHU48406.1 hypothetical protein AGMMS50289_24960 [Betaproteobacteria bacterium]